MADSNINTTQQVIINKEVVICPKCKKELNSANTRCPGCGTILKNAETSIVEETKETTTEEVAPAVEEKEAKKEPEAEEGKAEEAKTEETTAE